MGEDNTTYVSVDSETGEEAGIVKRDYQEEISELFSSATADEILAVIDDYHDNDIADVLVELSPEKRRRLYHILTKERISDIFAYIDENIEDYIAELSDEEAADIIEQMDADDAVDVLDELDDEQRENIISLMEDEAKEDIRLIDSYDDNLIGSKMTTNYICFYKNFDIKTAMKSLIRQSEENDNITTIYALNDDDTYFGAIELRDLILARVGTPLEDIILTSYPFVYAGEEISDCIDELRDYSEDSIPVLDSDNHLIGVITSTDITELLDDEMGEDYARLAGLSGESEADETMIESVRKRIPWLIILLGLGLLVSTVTGAFEKVISSLTLIVCFQSVILGMSGNVGTQSLAVTLRAMNDDDITLKEKISLVFKEARVGATNGFILGLLATIFIGIYIHLSKGETMLESFLISGCAGASLLIAMTISSSFGSLVPMIFKSLKIDPAVASGPMISTVSDLVAITVYYGLAWIFLINIFGFGA